MLCCVNCCLLCVVSMFDVCCVWFVCFVLLSFGLLFCVMLCLRVSVCMCLVCCVSVVLIVSVHVLVVDLHSGFEIGIVICDCDCYLHHSCYR